MKALAWTLLVLLLPARIAAATVLLLSTSNSSLDSLTKSVLEGQGHNVIVATQYVSFTSELLSSVNVVMLLPNLNWASGDMPLGGQSALVTFVNNGGGLITSEWTNWKVGSNSFATLNPILPVVPTTRYTGGSALIYTLAAFDPVLAAGLPSSFGFTADNFSGVESYFEPRAGATTFYTSSGGAGGAGVIGWSVGAGRVLQFSTVMGPNELGNADYARLVSNSVNWTAVPEPSTVALLLTGLAGFVWHLRRARAGR